MIISSLTRRDVQAQLSDEGIYFRTGPFIVHLKTQIKNVVKNFYALYGNYPLVEDHSYADFHVRIALPVNLRRWLKPQVFFYLDEAIPFKPLPFNQAYPMLEWGLNWCIANHAHQYLIVHAAAVEKYGKAIIFPAQPGSGKSTLSAALVSREWRLLSDELALISLSDKTVIPLARPINLKNESIDIIKKFNAGCQLSERYDDTNKGTVALFKAPQESIAKAQEPAMPTWIIQPQYQQGASTELTEQSRGRMFMHMADNSFNYSVLAEKGFRGLADLIDNCLCYNFTYSDLHDAVDSLESLVAK